MTLPCELLLSLLSSPAFIAAKDGRLYGVNEELRELLKDRFKSTDFNTLLEIGLFNNGAELRGFVRGFTKIGLRQQVWLPGPRLGNSTSGARLRAIYQEKEQLIVGVIDPEQKPAVIATERERVQEAELLNNLPYHVLVVDADGTIRYANAYAQDCLGVPESVSNNGEQRMSLQDVDTEFTATSWRRYLKIARQSGTVSYETTFKLDSGKLQTVEVTVSRVYGIPVRRVELVAREMDLQRRERKRLLEAELKIQELEAELNGADPLEQAPANDINIVGRSGAHQRLMERIATVAPTASTVLITGESGTGKELIARAIHAGSKRAKQPLVTVNCGALPRELIESELFGHRKGAFTGAVRDRVGQLMLADQGTLFLDEIGELPLELQTRLLRFLQEGEVQPVGSSEVLLANVRVIAATNRKLEDMVAAGTFREDLYYRLNVFPVYSPPLRRRMDDLSLLIEHLIDKYGYQLNEKVTGASAAFIAELKRYDFPGNVRELENIVQRALIVCGGSELLPTDLSLDQRVEPTTTAAANGRKNQPVSPGEWLTYDEMQRDYIERVLATVDGRVSGPGGAAELLGLNPQTLYSKIRKLGVSRKR